MTTIHRQLAEELGVREQQVEAAVTLLDGGATVPFVARYRKEATGALDDAQLRALEERLNYLRELEERRAIILNSIREQGKLDAALETAVLAADSKGRLEDIYLPYKPKRRTKAEIAKEAGLEPLADPLMAHPEKAPQAAAAAFVNADKQVPDVNAALDGARSILTERFAEDADLIGSLREQVWSSGRLTSRIRDRKREAGAKFSDYFDFSEALTKLPAHRILALFRGEKEEVLDLAIEPESATITQTGSSPYELRIMRHFAIADRGRAGDRWLMETARWAWRTKIMVHLSVDLRLRLWNVAEQEAVRVFAANLRDLLLAAPAGQRVTMGLDPGFRTGVKVAVVDATGKVVATTAIYPHEPQRRWDEALAILAKLARDHRVELIAIGNGTASRETDKLVTELVRLQPELKLSKIVVSEAGASVYSASAFASQELPDLDVTVRGAVSIARRLQDPLAELVKIDPKSIGVGQYQHDISEIKLSRSLDAVVGPRRPRLLHVSRGPDQLDVTQRVPLLRTTPMATRASAPQPEGQVRMGADGKAGRRLASETAHPPSLAPTALRRQTLKVGAVCGKAACTDLWGAVSNGRPTANENRGKSAILKRTSRGPGTEIAAARTK